MTTTTPSSRSVAEAVRQRLERGGERVWRLEDFKDLSLPAVAQALSRLSKSKKIQRLNRGTYFLPRMTTLGPSRPNPTALEKLAQRKSKFFPSGLTAANALGFSTQIANRPEMATSCQSLPRKLVGSTAVIHTRRPAVWDSLSQEDGALLDVLRHGARHSELSPAETVNRVKSLLNENGRLGRLLAVAPTEPPRVRAILGALAEQLGADQADLESLRANLNPLSRFDFGMLSALPNAQAWQDQKAGVA